MKKRRTEMFVTVSIYRAKAGEEDAIVALHEDWQRNMQPRVKGYLSGELLRKAEDLREFIAIMRFESQESARALANDPEQDAWYQRVVSLTENVPTLTEYTSEWP
jgi:antibiotic biosynthesis monooxygenase (ABM) superfamily enzyme